MTVPAYREQPDGTFVPTDEPVDPPMTPFGPANAVFYVEQAGGE